MMTELLSATIRIINKHFELPCCWQCAIWIKLPYLKIQNPLISWWQHDFFFFYQQPLSCFLFIISSDRWQRAATLEGTRDQMHDGISLEWMQQTRQQEACLDCFPENGTESADLSLQRSRSADYSWDELGWEREVDSLF